MRDSFALKKFECCDVLPGNENSNNNNNKVYDEHLEEESLQQESQLQTERNSESYSKTKATLEWRE